MKNIFHGYSKACPILETSTGNKLFNDLRSKCLRSANTVITNCFPAILHCCLDELHGWHSVMLYFLKSTRLPNHGYEPQSKLWKQFRSKLRGNSTYALSVVALVFLRRFAPRIIRLTTRTSLCSFSSSLIISECH